MESWVYFGVGGYVPRWFICPQTVTDLSTFVRESNPQLLDRKSDILPLRHHITWFAACIVGFIQVSKKPIFEKSF